MDSVDVERGEGAEGAQMGGIEWDAYASRYDLLATNNPSYHENIEIFQSLIRRLDLKADARVCDVGAGTGNFVCAAALEMPHVRFVHLDADAAMNEVAQQKYLAAGIENVEIRCCSATDAAYPPESFDLIVCVNALYAIAPQVDMLRRMRRWLKPSGTLFLIDYGRQVKVLDWMFFILKDVARRQGFVAAMRLLRNSWVNIRQNRRGSRGQAEGVYWVHSTEEFGRTLEQAGFEVKELRPCYRGYSDLAICRPRAP